MSNQKKTNVRAMTSLTVTLSFIMISFSGVMLYLSPKGRVANWTGWSLFGLSKEGWAGVHTTMALLFLGVCVLHIVYNWRPLLNYIKMPVAEARKRSRSEVVGAAAITLVVFLGTIYSVPPFSTVGAVGEDIKNYWETRSVAGPYTHAEEDTLAAFAEKLGRGQDDLRERLVSKGYAADDLTLTVKELADRYDVTPATLFTALSSGGAGVGPAGSHSGPGAGAGAGAGPGAGGGGYGRKSLQEVCAENNVALEVAIARLKEKGVTAGGGDNVRTLADMAGMNPGELLEAVGIATGH